jgi:hypothetical protein
VIVTPASLLRREFAEQIAPAYAADSSVVAVIVGGSAARGHADRFSDLELFIVRATPPTETGRRSAIAAAGGDLVRLYPVEVEAAGPVWADAWKIGRKDRVPLTGIEVDMHHVLVEAVERTLDDVLERFDPDPMKHNFVGGLLHATPLQGEATVRAWRERAAAYPDGLRRTVVQAQAQIEGLWRLDAYAFRGNPVAGYHLLTNAHEELLHTLLGLNRVYYPGFRSLERVVADLQIAPHDLLERVRASYPLRPERSKQILTGLVEETHDLIAKYLPEINVDRLRTILHYERPLWDDP